MLTDSSVKLLFYCYTGFQRLDYVLPKIVIPLEVRNIVKYFTIQGEAHEYIVI